MGRSRRVAGGPDSAAGAWASTQGKRFARSRETALALYIMSDLRQQIETLCASEKTELLDVVWESLEADALLLTDEQRAELDHRVERHEQNPSDGSPWEAKKLGTEETGDRRDVHQSNSSENWGTSRLSPVSSVSSVPSFLEQRWHKSRKICAAVSFTGFELRELRQRFVDRSSLRVVTLRSLKQKSNSPY